MAEPSRIRTIALFYGHVARNIGDLAINRGQVEMLARAFPGAAIRVALLDAARSPYLAAATASLGPEGTAEFAHVRGDPRHAVRYALDPGAFLAEAGLETADLIVLAAGEHLFQYEAEPNRRNLFWRTLPAFAARTLGKPCLAMPATFGPFEGAEGRALVRALLATRARAAARDARSLALLAEVAPESAPAAALDPAFFLPLPAPGDRSGARSDARRILGLVMRSEAQGMRLASRARAAAGEDDPAASRAVRFGAAFAEKVLSTETTDLRLLVQTETDRPIAEAIAAAVPGAQEAGRLTIAAPPDIESYLAELAAVDGVVAARFHALVMGLVAERPVFGVHFDVHGPKIPGLFDLLGQPDACADLSAGDPADAAAAAFARMAEPPSTEDMAGRLATLRQATLDWMRVDWPAPAAETRLESVQALGALATRLGDEASDRAVVEASQLRRQLRVAGEERDSRRAEAEQLRGAMARTAAELDAARNRVRCLEAEAALATDRARGDARVIRGLQEQLEMVEESTSFRLGHALVLGAKSPGRLAGLPVATWRLWRQARSGAAAPARGSLPPGEQRRLYEAGGVAAVIAAVAERSPSDAEGAAALVEAGIGLARFGIAEAEGPLLQEAVRRHGSDANLRALFWASQRAGDFATAWDCLRRIEFLYGEQPTSTQAAMLEKLRRSPAYQLSVLEAVPPPGPRAIEPIAGRVVYVLHNSLPWSSGGYATRAHGLALGMRGAGLEVVCLTRPGFPLDLKPELKAATLPRCDGVEGIDYHRIAAPLRTDALARDYMLAAADALEAELRRLRPEWVIAASNHVTALPALIAARRLGLPFLYEVRGFWEVTRQSREPEFERSAAFRIQELLEAEVARRADHVFTLTGPMRDELVRRGVEPGTITLLPNSCDPDRFTPRGRDAALAARLGIPASVPVIGYIGTFVQYEGLDDLVAACAMLRARGRDFRLMLIGNENASGTEKGPITAEIERIAAEAGLAERLIMPGRVPHEEVTAYYSLLDVAPFPRKPQPVTEMVSPMKPLEALAMEKAVVVSSVAALTEIDRRRGDRARLRQGRRREPGGRSRPSDRRSRAARPPRRATAATGWCASGPGRRWGSGPARRSPRSCRCECGGRNGRRD